MLLIAPTSAAVSERAAQTRRTSMTMPGASTDSRPAPSRAERRRSRKVADILVAASEVLAERGYHDTNLDEIAERIDVGKATLYHYFPNKEALVMACMDALGTDVIRQLREIASDTAGTARERLVALIQRQVDIMVNESPQLATLFRQPLDWPESYQKRIRELRREHYGIFQSVMRDGIADGEFVVDDENATMHNLFGAMNYVPVWVRPRRKKEFRETSQAIVDSLLRLFLPSDAT
jgi:AcrR family transcriptional regulator